jgi:hypothetical protein
MRNPVLVLCSYLFAIGFGLYRWNTKDDAGIVNADFVTMLIVGLIISGVSLVLSELLRPKPDIENAKPAGEGDFNFPTAIEGRPVPLIFGQVKVSGPNVTWWGDFRQIPIREKIKVGLWSKKSITTGFRYFVGIDMAICSGGAAADVTLQNVFIGDKPIGAADTQINEPGILGGNDFGSGGVVSSVEFFPGSQTQVASTYLDTFQTPISGQRGTAHYVFEGGWIGNTTAIKPFGFEVSRFPSRLFTDASAVAQNGDYTTGEHIVDSNDLNPMEIIYEAIRDDIWGMGRSSTLVDLANFSEAADTLHTEGNGFSIQFERHLSIRELLTLVQRQINGVLYFDRRTGLYKIKLARLDYTVNHTISEVTGGDTYTVPGGGFSFAVGQSIWADGMDNSQNNGRKTVAATTSTTVRVSETLINEVPGGTVYGGPRLSELNGINIENKVVVREFARQTWDGTTNQIRISFVDRAREYFSTFARSDNLANQRMQQGKVISSTINYPGCKSAVLANDLAARDLRFYSFPLAKATIIVTREFWDAQPAQVIRWTDESLGIIDLPIRLTRVDFGEIGGNMTLGVSQDIFSLEVGFFGVPPAPLWTLPSQGVEAIPTNQQLVFEAPKAIIDRDVDPLLIGVADRIFYGARAQAGETALKFFQRNNTVSPPGGTYVQDGFSPGLFLIGSLNVSLAAGDANPTTTIQFSGSPDSKSLIALLFDQDGASAAEIGRELANMIMIGDEFIGVTDYVDDGGSLFSFTTAYRGMLDSVPADHASSVLVYLLYVSGGLSDTPIAAGRFVEAQIRTVSRDAELLEAAAVTFSLQMDNRYLRPYPPFQLLVDAVRFESAPDLDATITNPGGDTTGIDVEWDRRDWETEDEVISLSDDAANLDAGFQAKHDHESQLSAVVVDGDGLALVAGQGGWINGRAGVLVRADVLSILNGEIPGSDGLSVSVLVRHTVDSVVYEARVPMAYLSSPTSAVLVGLTNLGTVFANGPVSRTYIVAGAVTHDLTMGTSITGVQYRINNGAWTALASLSGESFSINDELEFRHGDTSEAPLNTIGILDQDGADVAYVVFNTDTDLASLVGYWNMNEPSTGVSPVARAARFGSATDFTDNNDCVSTTGQFSNAVKTTDGVSDVTIEHLTISNALALRKNLLPVGAEEWTICLWIKLPAGGAVAKANQIFWSATDFDSGSPYTNRSVYLFYNDPPAGGFNFVFIENDGTIHSALVTFGGADNVDDEDKWIHASMVITTAAGGTLTVYIKDGATTPTPGYTNRTGCGTVQTTDHPLVIGAAYHSGSPEQALTPEEVEIDDFRIYKRALSEAQIDALVDATQPLT